MTTQDVEATITLVTQRADVLERFADGPVEKRDAVEDLDCSRSTLDRAVRDLADAGLLERDTGGYTTTLAGRLAAERYRAFLADEHTVLSARDALAALPADADLPAALLSGATVRTADGEPFALFDGLAARIQAADRYRAVLPRLADSRHLRLVHALAVRDALDVELLLGADALERLTEEFPDLAVGLADAPSCTVRSADAPAFGLSVVDQSTGGSTVSLLAYDGDRLNAVVHGDRDAGVDWANDTYAGVRESSRDADERLRNANADDRPLGDPSLRESAALASAGFERVDADYFARRTPNEPAAGWRAGFDLVDLYYGNGFERATRSGGPLADRTPSEHVSEHLTGRLADGANHVVLGPAGSGKSTVCRLTACRWVESGRGPVLYRRSPSDQRVDVGALVDAVDRADGSALVVVEDAFAVRDQLRELSRFVGDRDDATLLLETRESQWTGVQAVLDSGSSGDDAGALTEYRLPDVDEHTCQRAIDAFEAATGRTVPLSAGEVYDRVRTADGVGETYLLAYTLVAATAPAGLAADADRSALAADVESTYNWLAEEGDAAMEVGVLVAALTAIERPVRPALVYAVAARRAADDAADAPGPEYEAFRRVESALDGLDGRMVFGRVDDDGYRTHHSYWAVQFLEHALDRAERETVAAFERAVTAVFALATTPDRRDRVERWLGEPQPALSRLATPEGVNDLVDAVFGLGRRYGGIAPLLGTPEESGIDLPDACTPETRLRVRRSRVDAWYGYGDFDRVERAAEQLRTTAASLDADVDADVRAEFVAAGFRRLADVADDRGDLDTARDQLRAGLEATDDAASPRATVALRNALARVALRDDDYAAAADHLDAARDAGDELDACRERAETAQYLGDLHRRRGEFEAAETHLETALELYRDLGLRAREGAVRNLLGMIADDRTDYERAEQHYRRSLAAKRETRDRPGFTRVLFNLGATLLERGEYDAAADCFERSLDLADELGMRRFVGNVYEGYARLAYEQGNLDAAREYHGRQRSVYEEFGFDRGVASCDTQLGDVAREEGDLEEAIDRYEASYARFLDIDATRNATAPVERLVRLHDDRGDHERAAEWCRRGLELTESGGFGGRREVFEALRDDLRVSVDD